MLMPSHPTFTPPSSLAMAIFKICGPRLRCRRAHWSFRPGKGIYWSAGSAESLAPTKRKRSGCAGLAGSLLALWMGSSESAHRMAQSSHRTPSNSAPAIQRSDRDRGLSLRHCSPPLHTSPQGRPLPAAPSSSLLYRDDAADSAWFYRAPASPWDWLFCTNRVVTN